MQSIYNEAGTLNLEQLKGRKTSIEEYVQSNAALLGNAALQFNERRDQRPDPQPSSAVDNPIQQPPLQLEEDIKAPLQVLRECPRRALAPVCHINHLPTELLERIILDAIDDRIRYEEREKITINATYRVLELIHVSQRWRAILAKIVRLSLDLDLSFLTENEIHVRELWKTLAPPILPGPVMVKSYYADSTQRRILAAFHLLKVPETVTISSLHIGGSEFVSAFQKLEPTSPTYPCRILELYGSKKELACGVELEKALSRFVGVKRLDIRGLGDVMLGVPERLTSLTEVRLKDLGEAPLMELVREANQLRNLHCARVNVTSKVPCRPFTSRLRRLSLLSVGDIAWVAYVDFPTLEVLELTPTPSISLSNLIAHAPGLLSLDYDLKQVETVVELSHEAVNLTHIVLHVDVVRPIYDPKEYGLANPAFSSLRVLEVWLKEGFSSTSLNLIIQFRCLLPDNKRSLRQAGTSHIEHLILYWEIDCRTVEEAIRRNDLLTSAAQELRLITMYDGRKCIRMWLEWRTNPEEPIYPPDYIEWRSDIHLSASEIYSV